MNDNISLVFTGTLLLLWSPYLLVFFGRYGYMGLVKGSTLTNLGVRAGWIARIYGVLYLLFFAGNIYVLSMVMPGFLGLGLQPILVALSWPLPAQPYTGVVFIGLGLFFILMASLMIKINIRLKPSFANDRVRIRTMRINFYIFSLECGLIGFFAFFKTPQSLYLLTMSAPLYILLVFRFNFDDFYPAQKLIQQ